MEAYGVMHNGSSTVFRATWDIGTRLDRGSDLERAAPRLTGVVIEPDHECVSFVYVGVTTSLPRTFIPGIHPHIPLSARIDGGAPVHYQTPPRIG